MQGASVDWEWAQAWDLRQRSDEWLFLILAAGMGFLVSALLLLLRENPSTGMDLQMIGSRRDQRRLRRLVLPANCVQTVPQEAKKSSRSVAIPGVSDWRTTATDLLHVTAKAAMEKVIPRGPEARWTHRQVIPERLNQVDCRPVLVFVNTRSGGQQGFKVMTEMRNYLHTLQVVDLQREGPEAALKWWEKTGLRYRILVCGGDGTVGWVLGALYQLELAYLPPVGILPLGTGNDLARVTGWGGGFTASSVLPVLQRVNEAHAELLDRWTVTSSWLEDLRPSWLTGGTSQVKERRLKPMVMSNYFGIGVDAAVALDFHQMRERRPEWFWSQLVNKLWYFRSGAVAWLAKTCANIGSKIEVHCDGEAVEIPSSLEGIIVLNIPSFGGGTDLWGRAEDEAGDEEGSDSDGSLAPSVSSVGNPSFQGRQSMQDRKLEVVGVHGALQLGASQVGLYKAHRLAQGSSIKVTNKVVLPIEVDGEPMWFAKDGVIEITHQSQAFMLVNSKESSHAVATELVEWAEQQKVINLQQRNTMLKEISRRAGVRAPSSRKKPASWTRLAPD